MLVIMRLLDVEKLNIAIKSVFDDRSITLDAKLKFKLLTIMKQLEPHMENIATVRDEKIRQYGVLGETGQYKIDTTDVETFNKYQDEMTALLNSEVEVNLGKIKASEIINLNIPARYLVVLYDIIEEDL